MDEQHDTGPLGLPRTFVYVVGGIGLLMFVAIMGFAAHSGFHTAWPDIPGWLSVPLAILGPILFVLGVGTVCALHESEATRPIMQKVSRGFQLLVVLGVIAWMVWRALKRVQRHLAYGNSHCARPMLFRYTLVTGSR